MSNRDPVNDNYCYPDSDTLINNYDIRLESELAELERKITAVRVAELEQKPPQPSGYNLQKLCSIHKHIFKNLYEWAGKIRTVDIAKGKSLFCRAAFIEDAAQDVFKRLQKDNYLQNLPKDKFVEKLADYMTDVNVLHPFREGNGRTQRAFFKELAAAAGYNLDFDKTDKEMAITADIAAMNGNTDILKNMLHRIVAPAPVEREAQQKKPSIIADLKKNTEAVKAGLEGGKEKATRNKATEHDL